MQPSEAYNEHRDKGGQAQQQSHGTHAINPGTIDQTGADAEHGDPGYVRKSFSSTELRQALVRQQAGAIAPALIMMHELMN